MSSDPGGSPPASRSRLARAALVLGFVAVSLLRLHYVRLAPVETTDVLRNSNYGRGFWSRGFKVYDLRPGELDPGQEWNRMWPENTYDYPAVALLFFAVVGGLTHDLVLVKLLLSALELGNSLLVRKLTGSWPLALLYYASPVSLWWVSQEGQFESFQVALMLLALVALPGRPDPGHPDPGGKAAGGPGRGVLAWLVLALAVQVKLYPVVLVPLFLARAPSLAGLGAFALGFLPSLSARASSLYLDRWLVKGYRPTGFNPFAWQFWDRQMFDWVPPWLVAWEQVLSYGLLLATLVFLGRCLAGRRWQTAIGYLPLLLYLVLMKSVGWGEFWYFLLVPALAVTVDEPRPRALLLTLGLLEGRALTALFIGPVGFQQWFPMQLYLHGQP